MNNRKGIIFIIVMIGAVMVLPLSMITGCSTGMVLGDGDLAVTVEEGEAWFHEIPLFLFFTSKAPPQMAFWIEDTDGTYIETLFVTRKTATGEWLKAPGDSTQADEITRPESLPRWIHVSGHRPGEENAETDAVTGASPKKSAVLGINSSAYTHPFYIYGEINASLDFNGSYPEDAEPGAENYSGGPWGSGQPALVYRALVDPAADISQWEMELIGHSSPDGSGGEIEEDMSGITTAGDIVSSLLVSRNR